MEKRKAIEESKIVIKDNIENDSTQASSLPTSNTVFEDISQEEIPTKIQDTETQLGRIEKMLGDTDTDTDTEYQITKERFTNLVKFYEQDHRLDYKKRQELLDIHDTACRRLSSIMGYKFTENNPSFSASDAFQPHMLADHFGNLFNQEYTALHSLMTVDKNSEFAEDDKPIFAKLFVYIVDLYHQWMRIRDSVTKSKEFSQMNYYSPKTNLVEDSRRRTRNKLQDIFFDSQGKEPTLKKGFVIPTDKFDSEKNKGDEDTVNAFINKANFCVAAMMCQDSPLKLKWPEVDTKRSKSNCKPFLKKGSLVECNVWPAITMDREDGEGVVCEGWAVFYNKKT